jgi:hypothetical protein
MIPLLLSAVVACDRDKDPVRDDPNTDGQTPETGAAACGDAPVDALELRADPLAGLPFSRTLSVRLADAAAVAVTCELEAAPPAWRQLVPLQASWRYKGDGVDPGLDWNSPTYDDGAWASGPAPFGVQLSAATELTSGSAPAVAWFRTTFTVDRPEDIRELQITARRDDGIVVYIGGTEVLRDNVPVVADVGVDEHRTLHKSTVELSPGMLVAGENTLAVELHQLTGSPDAAFDLRLAALVAEDLSEPEVHLVEDPAPATDHTLQLHGLLADATYACVARSACGGETAELTVTTEPSSAPLPALALHPEHTTPSWGSYTLLNHQRPCADDLENRLLVIDAEGRPRWSYETGIDARSSIDIESALVGNDAVLWAGTAEPEGSPQIVGLDGKVRYRASYPGSESDVYHHDVEQLPNGRLLGLVESSVQGSTHTWTGFTLVEHDPATNEVTWRWDAADAFERGELPPAEIDDDNPYHANSLAAVNDADGEGVYVSLLFADQIIRIDRATGQILWKLGKGGDFQLVDGNGEPLPDDRWFDHVHAIDLYGDLLYLYDNGWAGSQSHAMALRIDSASHKAELVWSWTEFSWYEPNWGDADELPDGGVLIAMSHAYCLGGHADHPGALVEVMPPDDVIWRLDYLDSDDSGYRAQQLDGCAVFANSRYCPAVAQRIAEIESRE